MPEVWPRSHAAPACGESSRRSYDVLAQEWYGALAREIFNPNYVSWTCV